MQITGIACVPVDIAYRKTFRISGGGVDVQSNVLVKVLADDGTAGYGEASPLISYSEESQDTVIHAIRDLLAPHLIGQDPRDVDRLDDVMAGVVDGHPFAKGGLSMAVWDLAARAMGIPVYRLLGGKRLDPVPFVATVGMAGTEDMVADAVSLARAGFREVKVKIGGEPAADLARLAAIREAVGPEILIRADANQGYRSGDALPVLRRMEAVGLRWFEQPVPRWDRDGMGRLAAALDTNILADESAFTPDDVFWLACHGAADVINIKCSKYGLGNARRMAAVARAANLPCMVGSMQSMGLGLAASLHFCAANNFPYDCELDSVLYLVDDVLGGDPFSAVPGDTAWPVPNGRGYGVALKTVYEDALNAEMARSRHSQ